MSGKPSMAISYFFFQNFKLKSLAWKLEIFVVEILIVDMLDAYMRLETTYRHHKNNQEKSWVSNPKVLAHFGAKSKFFQFLECSFCWTLASHICGTITRLQDTYILPSNSCIVEKPKKTPWTN